MYAPINTEVPSSSNPNDPSFQEALSYFDDQEMVMHEVANVHAMDRPTRVRKHRSCLIERGRDNGETQIDNGETQVLFVRNIHR